MTRYLTSSFSLQMVPAGGKFEIRCLTLKEFKGEALRYNEPHYSYRPGCSGQPGSGGYHTLGGSWLPGWDIAAVGHEGTALALTKILGFPIPVNRQSITLSREDTLLVAQPTGKRIAYGEEVDFPELSFFCVSFIFKPSPRACKPF